MKATKSHIEFMKRLDKQKEAEKENRLKAEQAHFEGKVKQFNKTGSYYPV